MFVTGQVNTRKSFEVDTLVLIENMRAQASPPPSSQLGRLAASAMQQQESRLHGSAVVVWVGVCVWVGGFTEAR